MEAVDPRNVGSAPAPRPAGPAGQPPAGPPAASPPPPSAAAGFRETLMGRRSRRSEIAARIVFLFMSVSLVVPIVLILTYLIYQAWPSLTWEFLTASPVNGGRAGGIWPALIGTFYIVVGSLLVSAPIGVLAAVYLNEYARDNWFTRTINLAVVNLAGVPSIVHALFGLGAFVYAAGFGRSVLAASMTMAIMTMPVIIASTKEALGSVPMAFREACWNVGASRWQTIRTIVLPNSISGMLTGVILEVCRAAGETAPVLFTGAVFWMPVEDGFFPYSPQGQFMALSYHLFTISQNVPQVPHAIPFATAVVLLGLVVSVNATSIGVRTWLRTRKKW
jgi:phosphate transport system permease protein